VSRIYFHTEYEGTVGLLGAERAHISLLCTGVAMAAVPRFREAVLPHLTPDRRGYFTEDRRACFNADLRTALHVGDSPVLAHRGEPLESFTLLLNTALVLGSDPVCLAARLHGQCEIHAYVEGPNRAWLADVIEAGLDRGVYRSEMRAIYADGSPREPFPAGWTAVIGLLRQRSDEPVVTSYSATDGFPNPTTAGWEPESQDADPDGEGWYDVPLGEQWARGLAGLRGDLTTRREISPESLRAPYGHSLSLLDVFGESA